LLIIKIADKRIGQKRQNTQIGFSIPYNNSNIPKKSISPTRQQTAVKPKFYNEKSSPVSMLHSKKNSLNSQSIFPVNNSPDISKNNFYKNQMRKAHSPQIGNRKAESTDYQFFTKKPQPTPAQNSPKPMDRISTENAINPMTFMKDRSASTMIDNQLASALNQVQNPSHPSHLSNRTTTDSVHFTSSIRGNRNNSSNLFAPCGSAFSHGGATYVKDCFTPYKDPQPRFLMPETAVRTKNQQFKSMTNSELNAIQKTVPPKSRNNYVGSIDSTNTMNQSKEANLNIKCKKNLAFMSPKNSQATASTKYQQTITTSAAQRYKKKMSEEHSKIMEENESEYAKGDTPPEKITKQIKQSVLNCETVISEKKDIPKTQGKIEKPPKYKPNNAKNQNSKTIIMPPNQKLSGKLTPALKIISTNIKNTNNSNRSRVPPLSTIENKAARSLTFKNDSMIGIDENQVSSKMSNKQPLVKMSSGCLLIAGKKGFERQLSTRVLSHQGDDDEPYLP